MAYEIRKFSVFALLVSYFVLSFFVTKYPGGEAYPFFNWGLFSSVTDNMEEYSITISGYDQDAFDPPLVLYDAKWMFDDSFSFPVYRFMIQDLGLLLDSGGDQSAIAKKRQDLESSFLSKNVSYEVVKISYNPIEFWKEKKLKSLRSIATFNTKATP